MKVFLICLGCLLIFFLDAQQENVTESSVLPYEKQFFQIVVEGNNKFAFDFYQAVKNQQGNFCFSSYSVVSGLALAALGAKGETAQQLHRVFRYSLSLLPLIHDFNELLQAHSSISKNGSQIWLANALWLQKDLPFLRSFKLTMQRNFNTSLQLADFANHPSQSIHLINQWISQQTNGKINRLLMGQDVDKNTHCILSTAIYLKGEWIRLFDQKQTKRLPFRLSLQRTLLADMMHTTSDYLLSNGDKCDLLVLPYTPGNPEIELAMVIILPKKLDINKFEEEFTYSNWKEWLSKLQMETISLKLPRFRIESRWNLDTLSKSLGLSFIFSPEADFSGITGMKGLFINKAIHKTVVRFDERGTNATGMTPVGLSQSPIAKNATPYEFIVDQPFIFVIWEQKTDSILFMGRLSLP
jgi:serine protease inhibitor